MSKTREILELHHKIVYGYANCVSVKDWGSEEETKEIFIEYSNNEIKF